MRCEKAGKPIVRAENAAFVGREEREDMAKSVTASYYKPVTSGRKEEKKERSLTI